MTQFVTPSSQELNSIASKILNCAFTVHREMGPGLLESVYDHCLISEMRDQGLQVLTDVAVPLYYRGEALEKEYIIDLLVEHEVIVELKAVEGILAVHQAQLLSYLKLSNKRLGLLINFNVVLLKHGIKRLVNKL